MTSYNQMDSDFDNAKWEMQSTFGDIDNDDVAENLETIWKLTTKSDDARRILMPIIESINRLDRSLTSCKKELETLSELQVDELHIPHREAADNDED